MAEATYTGILKLKPDNVGAIKTLADQVAETQEKAVPLDTNAIHVTLIHQSILKPFKKQLKSTAAFPPAPEPTFNGVVYRISRPDKVAWIATVANQSEMQVYVNMIMVDILKSDPRPEDRVYHVSLANLTGSPFDSVGDVSREDLKREARVNLSEAVIFPAV